MVQTKQQQRLSRLYKEQDEIQRDRNPSLKKQFLINLMIDKLEKEIIEGKSQGI
tara:strand:+ start:117 stop:278 length:162 start_codon:yes stop_codon:yes gene_type:complete